MSADILTLYFPWPLCPLSNRLQLPIKDSLGNVSLHNPSHSVSHDSSDVSSPDSSHDDTPENDAPRPSHGEDDMCSLLSTGLRLCNSVRPVDTDSGSLLVQLIFSKYEWQ